MLQPLKDKPAGTAAVFDSAVALDMQGKHEEAADAYGAVLEQEAGHALAWVNLGTVLRKLNRFDAALACTKRALELSPRDPHFLMNYGNCLVDAGRLDEALDAHARAVRLLPGDLPLRKNYARSLAEAGRLEEALVQYRAALSIKPGHPDIRWGIAEALLQMGRFGEGWEYFESRLELPGMTPPQRYAAPRWRGEDLKGKTILVEEEQGFGDTILSSRYIPMVKARGARVIVNCRKNLHRLFQAIPGVDKMIAAGRLGEKFDYHVSMLSLPGIFGTDIASIPPAPPLHVPATPPEAARLLKRAEGRVKVGIVWSGNPQFILNHRRAAPVTRFLPLAEVPGVQLFSLQKGPFEKDLKDYGGEGIVIELGPQLKDFADTAAVLKQLDLVIMTDSAVAHLAGTLGRPVWNLLPFRPYWLYMSDRADCPWYPSMRLFRQQKHGDWDSVFVNVRQQLEAAVRQHSGGAQNINQAERQRS